MDMDGKDGKVPSDTATCYMVQFWDELETKGYSGQQPIEAEDGAQEAWTSWGQDRRADDVLGFLSMAF